MPIYEPRVRPDKYEMCRVIQEWVIERCGIQHATLYNLQRLNEIDLRLIYLAIGYKLDVRDIAHMEQQFQWEWERSGRTIDGTVQKAIRTENPD